VGSTENDDASSARCRMRKGSDSDLRSASLDVRLTTRPDIAATCPHVAAVPEPDSRTEAKGFAIRSLRRRARLHWQRQSRQPHLQGAGKRVGGRARVFFLALFALALGPRYLPTTRLTTMAAMPASTALAIGDDRMSMIGLDPDACC